MFKTHSMATQHVYNNRQGAFKNIFNDKKLIYSKDNYVFMLYLGYIDVQHL